MPALPATRPHAPDLSAIYSLADHLDASLALGEDLLSQALAMPGTAAGDTHSALFHRQQNLSEFARRVRALELAMTARLLQARARAITLRQETTTFTPLITLFVGGTVPLAEAAVGHAGGLGDVSKLALANGPDILAFLRSRALADAQSLSDVCDLRVDNDYLLAGNIHLGTLLDMIATFLDTLERTFPLFPEPSERVR